jgi:drug/metabolite transporter (DMT)-like permease
LLPLNPIVAIAVGSLWLGEPLGGGIFGGISLVVVGVVLVVAPNRTPSLWRGNQK